jgi:ATP-dependent helicase/nuclease subunit B
VTQAPVTRDFLGWDEPALPAAARRLSARYRKGELLDLERVLVVVPGQRAGRRLVELLAYEAEDNNLRLTPPQIVTQGALPERLYTPKRPFADDIAQEMVWAQALRGQPAAELRAFLPQPPAAEDFLRWVALGRVLRQLHDELAGDLLDFEAVARHGEKLTGFTDGARWNALAAVQSRYLSILDKQQLWDRQTARLKAIEFGEIRTDCDIVLLSAADLNSLSRRMLHDVAGSVTAFIIAPQTLADCFDEIGCLIPEKWCNREIPLDDGQLVHVDGPLDQADAVTDWLVQLGGRFRTDQVVIGVADESLAPQLQRQLEQCSVPARWVDAIRIAETAPYRLLAAALVFAEQLRYDDFAALVRHPDVEAWLSSPLTPTRTASEEQQQAFAPTQTRSASEGHQAARADTDGHPSTPASSSLAGQLDLYYNAYLPSRIRTGAIPPSRSRWPDLTPALERIDSWLAEASSPHPLREWGDIFRRILAAVYGGRTLDLAAGPMESLFRAFRRIIDACDGVRSLPAALDGAPLSAADAFQVVLAPLAREALPPPANPDAVEILGWLELPLDDSPAAIVTTFNEGFVPQPARTDGFLPDRLRRILGLLHHDRRYARDAFATTVLCRTRKDVRFIVARRDTNKDPLQPSRLVFACSDGTLVQRAQHFFADQDAMPAPRRPLLGRGGMEIPERSQFAVPRPEPESEPVREIPVTAFKTYLACPYRYYLRRVQKLERLDDSARELDGRAFGILLHGTLGAFGRAADSVRHSTRRRVVGEFLEETLQALVKDRYGNPGCRPAVRLQLEQARQRLQAFAAKQIELVQGGWHIVYAEDADDEASRLCVDFAFDDGLRRSILLVGRIDRIDVHESTGMVRVLDYKTADSAESPERTHRKGAEWIDLQLPLYRHLWPVVPVKLPRNADVKLAYFNLPKKLEQTDVVDAPWDNAVLADADRKAQEVVRNICNGVYEPAKYPPPSYCEDLAGICLDNMLGSPALSDGEGDAA